MYLAVAFYFLTPTKPLELKRKVEDSLKNMDVKGRIYISSEGINAQMSTHRDSPLIEWIRNLFPDALINMQDSDKHIFDRLQIKIRPLVNIGCTVDLSNATQKISPKQWKRMLTQKKGLLVDIRNNYESAIGCFEGAITPDLDTFKDFPDYVKHLSNTNSKDAPLMIFCTGGIRCEYISPLLKKAGFKNVYQLEGGILNYGKQEGSKFWKGDVFVFDDRLKASIGSKPISKCSRCNNEASYYNCSNMDCNALFLSCRQCAIKHDGLCSDKCQSGRIREINRNINATPTPFRKLPYDLKKRHTEKRTE